MCQVSGFMCIMSHVILFFDFFYKVLELADQGSVINKATQSSYYGIVVLKEMTLYNFLFLFFNFWIYEPFL